MSFWLAYIIAILQSLLIFGFLGFSLPTFIVWLLGVVPLCYEFIKYNLR